jgi:hypothetical protein
MIPVLRDVSFVAEPGQTIALVGEILVDRVRNRISPLKCNTEQWLDVMKIAHGVRKCVDEGRSAPPLYFWYVWN